VKQLRHPLRKSRVVLKLVLAESAVVLREWEEVLKKQADLLIKPKEKIREAEALVAVKAVVVKVVAALAEPVVPPADLVPIAAETLAPVVVEVPNLFLHLQEVISLAVVEEQLVMADSSTLSKAYNVPGSFSSRLACSVIKRY
jgi:hypothetical protein